MLFFHFGDAVVEGAGDIGAHHLDLIGKDRDGDTGFIHRSDMGVEILARWVQGQADFLGDNPFATGLGGEAIEQLSRHIVMVHIDDHFS
jgi:hypothetical protein